MAHLEGTLVAQRRDKLGTAESRRLRRSGRIPGNVYGHQQDTIALSVSAEDVSALIHQGIKVVDLELGGQTEKAMFRAVQWDTFGIEIQHFDLLRVDPNERVVVEVAVEFRGVSPGVLAGGILEQQLRTLTVECLAVQIPSSVEVRIGELELGQSIHVSDLELPEGAKLLNPPDASVVQVVAPAAEVEEPEGEEAAGGPAEPELIGRKAEDEAEGE